MCVCVLLVKSVDILWQKKKSVDIYNALNGENIKVHYKKTSKLSMETTNETPSVKIYKRKN